MDNNKKSTPSETPTITGICCSGIRQLPMIQFRSSGGTMASFAKSCYSFIHRKKTLSFFLAAYLWVELSDERDGLLKDFHAVTNRAVERDRLAGVVQPNGIATFFN